MPMQFSSLVLPKRHPRPPSRPCDDRAELSRRSEAWAILVADGATGAGDGWKASARMAETFLGGCWLDPTADGMAGLIRAADASLLSEQRGDADTTAIALVAEGDRIVGASAGDSQAFLVTDGRWEELTRHQSRKPRVGNGARPACFEGRFPRGAILVVATDGLWQQAPLADIQLAIERAEDPERAVRAMAGILSTRWPGGLPDDVGIVVGRRTP